MSRKQNLPEGWNYTNKRFWNNLEETGVIGHFYYEPYSHSIYQVTGTKRKRGGNPLLMKVGASIEARVRFVNPKDPEKTKVINISGSRMKATSFSLTNIFNDKEVKLVTC